MKRILTIALSLGVVATIVALVSSDKVLAKSMRDILPLPPIVYDAEGKEIKTETLRGKVVALYFSANWCIPCKDFTPRLVKFREENKDKGFEVVFMSLDRTPEKKVAYMRSEGMKWLTAPGQSSKEINHIMDFYKLPGVPSVIVFGPNGELITATARDDINNSPETALAKWRARLAGKF